MTRLALALLLLATPPLAEEPVCDPWSVEPGEELPEECG